MKQKQPKFSGILVVAVLMVLVLFIVSLSPLLAASGSKDTTYSEIYYYFENQQVTSFRLDLGTGSLELWLKEGKAALPESNAAASLPTGGLLTGVYSSDDNALPANGGTVYMTYKLPYGGDFNTGKISDFVDEYNAANPDAPMVFDYVAAKTSIPWLEIIFYVAMIGSIGMLFMSMYRGGAGGGIRVKAPGIHGVAGHGKVRLSVDMVTEHEPPRRDAAAEEVVRKQLVHQMGGAPGQRHGRVDDVAVHHDFSPGAEYAHHAADRGTDLAGRVVVDDVVVLMGAQVGGQGADAVLFVVRHGEYLDAVRLERRGRAGLVRRALTDEKGDAVFGGIEVQEQVLDIPLYAALHAEVVADH